MCLALLQPDRSGAACSCRPGAISILVDTASAVRHTQTARYWYRALDRVPMDKDKRDKPPEPDVRSKPRERDIGF
jgi:hypothetical protein